MKHNLENAVRVDLRRNGHTYSETYGPGITELPDPVAEILVAQGFATPASKGKRDAGDTPRGGEKYDTAAADAVAEPTESTMED